jgi:hypothetical protein
VRSLIACAVFCVGLVWLLTPRTAFYPHGDAADYLMSVKKPWKAQYLGAGNIDLPGFLHAAFSKSSADRHMWDQLERAGDISAARHFHVPLGLHAQALIEVLGLPIEAHQVPPVVFAALSAAALFVILDMAGVRLWVSLAFALIFLLNPSVHAAERIVSPHALFCLLSMMAAGLFSTENPEASPKRALLALICVAAAVATLELSPLLVLGLTLAGAWHWFRIAKPQVFAEMQRRPLWACAGVLAVLGLAWPAGLLRGGYVISYGTFLYQGLFRRDAYFGSTTLLSGLKSVFAGSLAWPALIVILLVYGAWQVAFRRPPLLWTVAWTLLCAFCLQGVLNRFHNDTYALHMVAFLCLFAALVCERILSLAMPAWGRTALTVAIGLGLIVSAAQWMRASRASAAVWDEESRRMGRVLESVREIVPPGSAVLANQHWGPMKLYLPALRFEPTAGKTTIEQRPGAGLNAPCWAIDLSLFREQDKPELAEKFPGRLADGFLIGCPGR